MKQGFRFPMVAVFAAMALPVTATQISFTGGTVYFNGGGTATTNNNDLHQNVDYYEESGFRLDFSPAATPFSSNVGWYYRSGRDPRTDVLHGHWATGDYGALTRITATKIDGGSFDLNYLALTSNTDTGGRGASGNERVFIHASIDGVNSSYSHLLPPDDWGFPAKEIFLGSQFDGIKAFWLVADNAVDCFGIDDLFIDEEAPGAVPEPGSMALAGLCVLGLIWRARRR